MKRISSFFQKNPVLYAIFHILISSIIAFLIASLLYPDLLINHKYSFIRFSDSEIDFYGVFTIVSNFLHGKIQLWDNYDLMPLAYFYLNGGLTSFSNLTTALTYLIFSPLFPKPAEFFHSMYSVVYFYSLILLRTSGFYLLLKRFTRSNIILLFSTVFASSFLSPQTYLGLNNSNIFCFYPLVIHFILCTFETRKLNNLLLTILTMVVAVGSYPFMGLGYFYLGVHLTVISIIIYFILSKGIHPPKISFDNFILFKKALLKLMFVILISVLIMLPFVILLKENYKDYDFAHEKSRFANLNILDITSYFKRDYQIAYQPQFFYRMINYKDNRWETEWLFLGITALFFSLCGLILNKDKRKYIFLLTAILFFLLNSPREMFSIFSLTHWIVTLTDPFNFILRTSHMTGALMLPFVLLPLITLGMDSIFRSDSNVLKDKFKKILLITVVLEAVYINVYSDISNEVNLYLMTGFLLIGFILYLSLLSKISYKNRKYLLISAITILLFLDGNGMRTYFSDYLSKVNIIPQNLPYTKEKVFIDYQNPNIIPFREFYTTDDQTYDRYFNKGIYNNQGLYFHYTNYFNYFTPSGAYNPRHISFKNLPGDVLLQNYLKKDNRMIFDAQLAVLEKEGLLTKLLDKNQDRSIILIDRIPENITAFSKTLPINFTKYNTPLITPIMKEILLGFSQAKLVKENDLNIIEFDLPLDFPKYLATGIFSKDISQIIFAVDDKEFTPAQGKLIFPYTFDIGNIKTNKLLVALPKSYDIKNKKGYLKYFDSFYNNKLKIVKNEPDNLTFSYIMDKDGWLVLLYPYDRHFQMTVDDKKIPIYKVNSDFIGVPISNGIHNIILQYWPDTWLRQAMGLSMFLLFALPIFLVWFGIKGINEVQMHSIPESG